MIETRQQRRFKARKGERTTGFDGYVGKRQAAAIVAEEARQRALGHEGTKAFEEALRICAGRLPALPLERRNRAPRPSKSDDPLYRDAVRRRRLAAEAAQAWL